jgi:hypothetical protein
MQAGLVVVPPSAVHRTVILFGGFIVFPPAVGIEAVKAMGTTQDDRVPMRVASFKALHFLPTLIGHMICTPSAS